MRDVSPPRMTPVGLLGRRRQELKSGHMEALERPHRQQLSGKDSETLTQLEPRKQEVSLQPHLLRQGHRQLKDLSRMVSEYMPALY